ncbi:MAG: hydrolase [Acidimicrobiales bacterium]|nr:hydrolase [Acidimicrobiales bacterium]
MPYCDECGRRCEVVDPAPGQPPACPEHGPRWRLVRNAPCAAVVIERDGLVLLAQRAHEPYRGAWEVPGGFVEQGEHPQDAACREVREELGITVELTGLVGIYVDLVGHVDPLQITVYAGRTRDIDAAPDPAEVAGWRWFRPEDLPTEMAGDHRQRLDDWLAGRTVPLSAGADPRQ